MREVSYVVAFFGALFLLAAAAAWWKVVSETEEESAVGRPGHSQRVKSAARATAIAFALSGIAAIVAVVDWFMR